MSRAPSGNRGGDTPREAWHALRQVFFISPIGMAVSLALAFFTKGTAYIYGPAVLVGIFSVKAWNQRRHILRALPVVLLIVLVVNGAHYWRNFKLCGSPLGCDSAHGDGRFRWRNDRLGLGPTISNALRHLSDQLGTSDPARNEWVYRTVLAVHKRFGLDPNDPATTWTWSEYGPPSNTNHEADANNRWHLLLAPAMIVLFWKKGGRSDRTRLFTYSCSLVLAFLWFCFYLKWAPYNARLFLSLFVLWSPVIGLTLEQVRPTLQAVVCFLLLIGSRPFLEENWLRRLKGPNNLFEISRTDAYFTDIAQYNNKSDYLHAVELTLASGCEEVGIDTEHFALEYPYQALLREAIPEVRFQHTGVKNQSALFRSPETPEPCVVLCLNCSGISEKLTQYEAVGEPVVTGRFVVFSSPTFHGGTR